MKYELGVPPTIEYADGCIRLIDQTLLPGELKFLEINDYIEMVEAIKRLSVRGAPAIGVAGAFGLFLAAKEYQNLPASEFGARIGRAAMIIGDARPTAVNLWWAVNRCMAVVENMKGKSPFEVCDALLEEALKILEEDRRICRAIGKNGGKLLKDNDSIITHCNAGSLATSYWGTALSVIYDCILGGKKISVFADETRPLLQGARLTSWELDKAGVHVTVITDGMAAHVMKRGGIDAVITGADRIAANGDAANKIGTYSLALSAKYHRIPFYVAAPVSTFDMSISDGSGIPIEERDVSEVSFYGGVRTVPEGVKVYNPAFDVTPASFISAIITERGIIEKPNADKIRSIIN